MHSEFMSMPLLQAMPKLFLNYLDILTYFTIRTFLGEGKNSISNLTYEMIANRMDALEQVVKTSVKNLALHNLIIEEKQSDGYNFEFVSIDILELMVPVGILTTELTYKEKAILLILKSSCIENDTDIFISIKQIGEQFGLSVKEAFELVDAIMTKGYLNVQNSSSGNHYFQLCGRVNWKCTANDHVYTMFKLLQNKKQNLAA